MKRIKVTKELIKQLQPFWERLQDLEGIFWSQVADLEEEMEEKTGIKDIMFFMVDGEHVGIGNADKTMRLIHNYELTEFKQGLEECGEDNE